MKFSGYISINSMKYIQSKKNSNLVICNVSLENTTYKKGAENDIGTYEINMEFSLPRADVLKRY